MKAKARTEASSRAAAIAREMKKIEKQPALTKSLPASNRAPAKMPKIDRRINSWRDVSGASEGEKEALLKAPRMPIHRRMQSSGRSSKAADIANAPPKIDRSVNH